GHRPHPGAAGPDPRPRPGDPDPAAHRAGPRPATGGRRPRRQRRGRRGRRRRRRPGDRPLPTEEPLMDPAGLIGIGIAFAAIFGALFLEGADPMSIFLPAPLLLVWVGTV